MQGLMMDSPLTVTGILERASRVFPEKQVVSRMSDGLIHRYTYADFRVRVARLMGALRTLGVRPGDRVGTYAWNHYRHLELYYAVPCMGAVAHTLNVRLFPEQVVFIANHAQDAVIFVDRSLAEQLIPLQDRLTSVRAFVVMDDGVGPDDVPLRGAVDYEELLAAAPDTEDFPDLDERSAAGLCYTSGTTGEPKGVLYSHRSFYLQALAILATDAFGIGERDIVLPVVPMFHANAWGLPHAAPLTGASLVFPGAQTLGAPLAELIEAERVTFAAGVPVIWNLLHQHLRSHPRDISSLRAMVVGGSAAAPALIEAWERDHGIHLIHAWGMTETSPVGSICRTRVAMDTWSPEDRLRVRGRQGIPVTCMEVRALDDDGREVPWDGKSVGEMVIRGPWVMSGYYGGAGDADAFTPDGWFRTGDVVTIDRFGYIQITDRRKDVIKSRGEWISSLDMEAAVMEMPDVLEAAVVGRPDDLRGEAPVVFVVPRPDAGAGPTPKAVVRVLSGRFARWQLPKAVDVHVVEAIPKTSVGKHDKKVLRKRLEDLAAPRAT